jgi:hypothetical protein
MSALHLKTDIAECHRHVRFVPIADRRPDYLVRDNEQRPRARPQRGPLPISTYKKDLAKCRNARRLLICARKARSRYRELRRACTMLYVRPKFYRSTKHIAGERAVAAFEMTCARVSDLAAYKKRCVPDFRGDRPVVPCAFEWERPPAVL